MAVADRRSMATRFYRRQLVLAGLTAAVVLVASVVIVGAMSRGAQASRPNLVLRTAADGSVLAVPSSGDAPRGVVWAAGGALGAVSGLVIVLVGHTVKVARFAAQERKES